MLELFEMKRIKLDSVLVIDLEATCWEPKPSSWGLTSDKLHTWEFQNEIIEIGVCELDLTKGIIAKESILIKPKYSKVSEFCTQLTTLTQKDVDAGISLQDGCALLQKKYDSQNKVWVSYGDYDRKQFEKECRYKSLEYPFGPRHHNIKNLFALMFRLKEEVGMPEALGMLGIKLEGTHHRGVDDAVNIAKIAQNVLSKR